MKVMCDVMFGKDKGWDRVGGLSEPLSTNIWVSDWYRNWVVAMTKGVIVQSESV